MNIEEVRNVRKLNSIEIVWAQLEDHITANNSIIWWMLVTEDYGDVAIV